MYTLHAHVKVYLNEAGFYLRQDSIHEIVAIFLCHLVLDTSYTVLGVYPSCLLTCSMTAKKEGTGDTLESVKVHRLLTSGGKGSSAGTGAGWSN